MSDANLTPAISACDAEWAPGVPCPHPVPRIPKAFRIRGFRSQSRCYLHRGDNVISKVLHLLTEKGSAVLARCPHGCLDDPCPVAGGMRRDTFCRDEVAAAVGVIKLAAYQLCALSRDLAPQQFRLLADLATARVILRRIEAHLAREGVVEEVVTTSNNGERVTRGTLSSFLEGRARLLRIIRQHELDLGLYDTVPEDAP